MIGFMASNSPKRMRIPTRKQELAAILWLFAAAVVATLAVVALVVWLVNNVL